MADIDTSETFADGETVNAARLNNIIDQAAILEAFISGQDPVTDFVDNDLLVISRAGALKHVEIDGLVTSVGLTMPSPFVVAGSPVTGSDTLDVTIPAQAINKVFASPATGSSGAPSFRYLKIPDYTPVALPISALQIDWSLTNTFFKTLTAASNPFTFANMAEGQTIKVIVQNATHPFTWPVGILWRGGTTPVPTSNGVDIFTFLRANSFTFGYADLDFS